MNEDASKIVEAVKLEDHYWAPLFLNLLALLHFALSAVLIASYWHFRVRGVCYTAYTYATRLS
jgi:hypothetical protein